MSKLTIVPQLMLCAPVASPLGQCYDLHRALDWGANPFREETLCCAN